MSKQVAPITGLTGRDGRQLTESLLDNSRPRDRFGWEARLERQEGLGQTIAWMRQILQSS